MLEEAGLKCKQKKLKLNRNVFILLDNPFCFAYGTSGPEEIQKRSGCGQRGLLF